MAGLSWKLSFCRWIWALLLVNLGGWMGSNVGFAQGLQVPDSVSLTDPRFFGDPAIGKRFGEIQRHSNSPSTALLQDYRDLYQQALAASDSAAAGIVATEISAIHLRAGEVAQAFDWVNHALSLDSLIRPLSPLRQQMHRNLAGIYGDFEAYNLALRHYKLALSIDETRGPQPSPRRFRYCSSTAIFFQRAGLLDSAFAYYNRCIQIAQQLDKRIWEASAANNLGMALQAIGQSDSALVLYRSALAMLDPNVHADQEFAVSIRDNIGEALLTTSQFSAALPLFERNFADHQIRPNEGAHLQAGLRLVNTLIGLGQVPQAQKMLHELDDLYTQSAAGVRLQYYKDWMKARILVAKRLREWENAATLESELMAYQDSLQGTAMQLKVRTLEGMLIDKTAHFKTEISLTRQAAAETSAKARFQTLLIAAFALIILLMLAVVLINFRRRATQENAQREQESFRRELAELNLQNERLQNAQLNHQLEMKRRDITDYALVYSQRRNAFEEILENLKQIKRQPNPERGIQELMLTLKGKIDAEGKLHLETQHIEKVNHAFFDELKQKFPSLSPSELELCGMLRLGHTSKDIALRKNIAPSSVRIAKTRLKKKMGLGAETDLGEYLTGI
jgi:tetratricopeptide (TPR) repeat protein